MKKRILLIALIGISFGMKAQITELSNGNVGIGTTNPGSKLEIKDNIEASLTFRNINGTFRFRKLGNDLILREGSPLTGNRITFQSGGNIGIGTNTPSATLHVNSTADVGRGQNPAFLIGNRTGGHIAIDNNEIGAFNNNANSILYINGSNSTSNTIINGDGTGNVGIGTMNPNGWRLAVNGNIKTKEVKVTLDDWPDFVFYDNYKLPTLTEVENHINEKGHLKDIPSAKEVEKNGIFLGEMNAKLLQKIEELTLYTIQQQKEIISQKEKVENIEKENSILKTINLKLSEFQKRLEKLEKK